MKQASSKVIRNRREFLVQTGMMIGAAALPRPLLVAAGRTAAADDAAISTEANMGRIEESFDFGWKFARGGIAGAESPEFDDSGWRPLHLPHDWGIEGPYNGDVPTADGGAGLPAGEGWYRKWFRIPAALAGRRVVIRFDGVYMDSTVWLNGRRVGNWPYGYSSFHYDLTPHLAPDGGPNLIAVRVDNSRQPGSRWYSGSGIYRHVWITLTDPLHVEPWGVWITTPAVTPQAAQVRVRTRVSNNRTGAAPVELLSEVLDAGGAVVGRAQVARALEPGEIHEFDQTVDVPAPRLWSPQSPQLYAVRTRLLRDGILVDECRSPFGIRTIEFDVERGFLLNGKPGKFLGMCLHHDGGAVGAAVPDDVLARRLRLLKEMGCNAVRTSHNPMAPEFYDLCDQIGLLVMNEAFDEWVIRKPRLSYGYSDYFKDWWERDLLNFIHRDRNHPSVVIWSAGNEIHEQSADFGSEVLRPMVELFHREDPTRPVTAGLDRVYTADPVRPSAPPEFVALLDVAGYNYADRWEMRRETVFATDRAAFPQRRFVGTEDDNLWGARGSYGFKPAGNGLPEVADYTSNASGLVDTSRLWRFCLTHDYDTGHFMWTGFDYLGEARWPRRVALSGVFDTCGFPKAGYYFYRSIFQAEPVLHLLPHWNWPGREGRVTPVVAFTNCEVVELFLNGRSLGAKVREFPRMGWQRGETDRRRPPATTADLHLAWDVPYEPGLLRAVGYRGGAEVATAEVSTAQAASRIELDVDRARLAAGGRGVAHIAARIVDYNGVLVPDAAHEVTITVSGAGALIGVDNGNPYDHSPHQQPVRKAFHGMCLALVRAGDAPGVIDVEARADGLLGAACRIAVTPSRQQPPPVIEIL